MLTAPAPIVSRYVPRGAARELFARRDPEVLMAGPAGTGKSLACLWKLHTMCLKNDGMRGLIARKVQRSIANTALDTYRKFVATEALNSGIVRYYGGSDVMPPQYQYIRNGKVAATIMIGGMDNPTKIMSSEYDMIYVQEATELTVTDWEMLATRKRNWRVSFQQLMADCNPVQESHWLKQRCNRGQTTMLLSRHVDNPALYNDDGTETERGAAYMANLRSLTGVRRARLLDGKWASSDGQIYQRWDDAVHLIDRFEVPDDWPCVWTVDFGFTHPFVLQCWRTDPDGRLILEWEIYRTERLVEDHAETVARYCMVDPVREVESDGKLGPWRGTWRRPRPSAIVCDHDAGGRATLSAHLGIPTRKADKAVDTGIQATDSRMKVAGDGRPRLMIMRDACIEPDPARIAAARPASTAEEVAGYVWAVKPGGNSDLREEPNKVDDDGMDAMRYRVMAEDGGFRPRVRWM